jgi:hypothetical protein
VKAGGQVGVGVGRAMWGGQSKQVAQRGRHRTGGVGWSRRMEGLV